MGGGHERLQHCSCVKNIIDSADKEEKISVTRQYKLCGGR